MLEGVPDLTLAQLNETTQAWVEMEYNRAEKWLHHIDSSLFRPVLLIDEAQEMSPPVFSELRLLSSADLDSRSILTTVLAGDRRLANRLEGNLNAAKVFWLWIWR
jgi:type II secretory pathway predicted ATPase ExeA